MKSGLKIKWSEEATNNLDNIIAWLETNWTQKELRKFFQKFEKQLLILSLFPEAYPVAWAKKRIHRCVFTKSLTIYYSVNEDNLELLSIFDTRQLPSKAKI
ncbi:MAG: type II toxin-antitoxin system RelE/ParE family toxin [Chlorobium sp.]|nr:MAG: type II toxin-antitoxin system RelE/ParE family toxin [Chlorobium sp.]